MEFMSYGHYLLSISYYTPLDSMYTIQIKLKSSVLTV